MRNLPTNLLHVAECDCDDCGPGCVEYEIPGWTPADVDHRRDALLHYLRKIGAIDFGDLALEEDHGSGAWALWSDSIDNVGIYCTPWWEGSTDISFAVCDPETGDVLLAHDVPFAHDFERIADDADRFVEVVLSFLRSLQRAGKMAAQAGEIR